MAMESLRIEENEALIKERDNSLLEFQGTLKEAVSILNYPSRVIEFLKTPMRFLEVSIPLRMDNGEIQIFQAYLAQHNDAPGPTKGGVPMD